MPQIWLVYICWYRFLRCQDDHGLRQCICLHLRDLRNNGDICLTTGKQGNKCQNCQNILPLGFSPFTCFLFPCYNSSFSIFNTPSLIFKSVRNLAAFFTSSLAFPTASCSSAWLISISFNWSQRPWSFFGFDHQTVLKKLYCLPLIDSRLMQSITSLLQW